MQHTAVLLVNLGTPDSPSVRDVRSYLSQFLNDPRVIDIPWLSRKILVNLVIVPFRSPKSAKVYQQLWTKEGSPLLIHSERARNLLQRSLGESYSVHLAMRYKNPSIPGVLDQIRKTNPSRIIVLPMFPQYASATTGSVHDEVMRVVKEWWVVPDIQFISQYHDHPQYIAAFADRGKQYDIDKYDHVIFSYHGLPERQVEKVHGGSCRIHRCAEEVNDKNRFCYRATCYETSRLLASALSIPQEKYTVTFQSRLDSKWLRPFSDDVVADCAKSGMKNILVFSPAFTADCLETLIEIGVEYQEIFHEHGGGKVQLVESLNDHPDWIRCLHDLVRRA